MLLVPLESPIAPSTVPLIPLESPQWVRVHQGDFVMFGFTMHELLNFEQFCEIFFKKKLKVIFLGKFWWAFDIVQKVSMSEISWRWFCNFET
jgi:hypothetical protein